MAKSELGTKRICPTTGKKFYDLNKNPVISPYTGEVVPILAPAPSRGRGSVATASTDDNAPEAAELETVSLEEADAEATGKKDVPESEDDIEVDDTLDDEDDDSTFIAEEEEGEDDVTDIIGDVSDDEEN